MLTGRELEELADSFQAKADTAYRNYQDTGTNRYYNTFAKNEDIAEALRYAAQSADLLNEFGRLKASVGYLAGEARKGVDIRKALITEAEIHGLIEPEDKPC